ncbi:MAG: hypothetical protein HZB30_02580 [Nitrospirae bacterium]|nr:hypothetical protein [Nitrospirota bacterium]
MKYEKEMIPVLTEYLNNQKGYSVITNELDSGYGIADIVATTDLKGFNYHPFNNIFDVFLLNNIPSNKPVSFEDIWKMSSYSKKHLKYTVLKDYIEGGFLKKDCKGYMRIRKLKVDKNPIIAIEAKLKKWKEAFFQTQRYKKYADFCYVALPEKILQNVDLHLFRENNIGLLAISQSKSVHEVLNPKKNRDKHDLYSIFVNGVLLKNSQPAT